MRLLLVVFLILSQSANAAYFGAWSPQNVSTIASVDAAALSTPVLNSGSNVQYFCDCKTDNNGGAISAQPQAGCISGSDANNGLTEATAKQTFPAAWTWLNSGLNHSALMCQGGVFDSTASNSVSLNTCPVGQVCNELREYVPQTWNGNGVKPIIISLPGYYSLVKIFNGSSGYRFMNFRAQGNWNIAGCPTSCARNATGFDTYSGSIYNHDIQIINVDLDYFDTSYGDETDLIYNVTLTGNHITNSSGLAFFGGGNNYTITKNSFINNGSNANLTHQIYLGGTMNGVNISGNYISGFAPYPPSAPNTNCLGTILDGHGAITDLTISGNILVEASTASAACYGISITNNTSDTSALYVRGALVANNTVINGGSTGIGLDGCSGNGINLKSCALLNNIVVVSGGGGYGITMPIDAARTGGSYSGDDKEGAVLIANNTVFFGASNSIGAVGLRLGNATYNEAAGSIVVNNTFSYMGTGHGLNNTVGFSYLINPSLLAYVDYNNFYSADNGYQWEGIYPNTVYTTLSAWQSAYSTFDAHSSTSLPTSAVGWVYPTLPAWNDSMTWWQWLPANFVPTGTVLPGKGSHTYAPYLDATNWLRANPPAIGAYE